MSKKSLVSSKPLLSTDELKEALWEEIFFSFQIQDEKIAEMKRLAPEYGMYLAIQEERRVRESRIALLKNLLPADLGESEAEED